jgi:hypothetical protein
MTEEPEQTQDLHAEVEALRAELAQQKSRPSWTSVWRPVVSGILLAVVVLLAPLCVVARWTHGEVSDTDKYVNTVAPLARNPEVQAAIAHRITTLIFQYVDVQGITDEAANALAERGLSDRATTGLKALSGPLDSAVQSFVEEKVLEVVQTDAFEQAWDNANRQAHNQLVAALTGDTSGSVQVSGDEVRISLAAFVDTVKQSLIDQGFGLASQIPTVDATFVLFSSSDLGKAQKGFHLLDVVATVLPILTLLLIAIAVFVARSRRAALIAAGLCVALGMVLLGLLLTGTRPFYLDALPDTVNQQAAGVVYDTLISSMRRNLRIIGVVALLVAAVAWAVGPSKSARRLRSTTTTGAQAVTGFVRESSQRRVDTGEFGRSLWDLRTPVRIGIVVIGVAVLLSNNPLSAGLVIWTIVLMLIAWFVLELLATPPEEEVQTVGAGDEPPDKSAPS